MSALAYRVLDPEDRDVTPPITPPTTMSQARRIARLYGPGSVVLGARNQVIYTVKQAKEPKS